LTLKHTPTVGKQAKEGDEMVICNAEMMNRVTESASPFEALSEEWKAKVSVL
jgi:hypothetical protein